MSIITIAVLSVQVMIFLVVVNKGGGTVLKLGGPEKMLHVARKFILCGPPRFGLAPT